MLTLSVTHASQDLVIAYDQLSLSCKRKTYYSMSEVLPQMSSESHKKIYNRLVKVLPNMPTALCGIMVSFLEPELDWGKEGVYVNDLLYNSTFSSVVYLDSHHVAAGTKEGHIQIWKPQRRASKPSQLIAKLVEHTSAVGAIDYDPITKMLASGSNDGSAVSWSLSSSHSFISQEKLVTSGRITTLSFLDRAKLAIGGENMNLILWDLEAKKMLSYVCFPGDCVQHVVPFNNSVFIVVKEPGSIIQFHSTSDGMTCAAYDVSYDDKFFHVTAISPEALAVSGKDSVKLFDIRNMSVPVNTIKATGHRGSLLTRCKDYLGVVYSSDSIRLWKISEIIKAGLPKSESRLPLSNSDTLKTVACASSLEGNSLTVAINDGCASGFMKTWNLDHIK